MSGPPRWRDAAGGASPAVRGLLDAGRRSAALPPASRARSAAHVARLAAAPTGLTTLSSVKGIASAAAMGAAAAVIVIAAASLLEKRVAPPPPISAPMVAPAPTPSASPSATVTASPSATASAAPPPRPTASAAAPRHAATIEPIEPAPSAPPAAPPAPPPQGAADTLVQETAILEQARAALAKDPARALIKLDEHAAMFPAGKLGLEREMMAMQALHHLGRAASARARGEALLPRIGGTPYDARVRRLLEDLQ